LFAGAVERYGQVDVLVKQTPPPTPTRPALDTPDAAWDTDLDVNLRDDPVRREVRAGKRKEERSPDRS